MTLDFAHDVLARLLEAGASAAEVFVKRGRSRRFEVEREAESVRSAEEAGWAVRAARGTGSFFYAATGTPAPLERWPEADRSGALALPAPSAIDGWVEAADVAEPVLGEDEGRRALRRLVDDVARRLPAALVHAALEDGASEIRVLNHRGVDVSHRARLATLRVEARAGLDGGEPGATLVLAERAARRLPLQDAAERLADLFAVREPGSLDHAASSDVVLAPEVAARVIAPLAAAFVDRSREEVAALLEERDGRVAWEGLSLIDDGRHPRGALSAPVDGEGVRNAERILIDGGRLADTILPWERAASAIGCRARPGWRDLPRVATSHVVVEPCAGVTASSLIADLDDGAYLLDAGEEGSYDLAAGRWSLPVWGFRIASGRPLHPLGRARLVGDPRTLLHGVCGVASDLRFTAVGMLVGAPSLRVRGLSLVAAPDAAPGRTVRRSRLGIAT